MTITVIRKHTNPDHIYCGRGSPVGNPFPIRGGTDEERDEVCIKYEEWFYGRVDIIDFTNMVETQNTAGATPIMKMLVDIYNQAEAGDVNLGCFCAPKRCHCDTIKQLIEITQEHLSHD